MPRRDPSRSGIARASRLRIGGIAAGAAVIVVGGVAAGVAVSQSGSGHASAPPARLLTPACSGPAGAAYVSDAGWDGFSAIDTSTCKVIQTYNVGHTPVPGDSGDNNYASTNEGVALHGDTLYFADAGNSTVAVIDTSKLSASNYNPAEKLINVGLFPQDLAVTPDGKQVWVAETGPQTSPSSPAGVAVISAATDKVVAKLHLSGSPSQIAFSPSGSRAYVATADGLWVYNTASRKVVGVIRGLGDPRGVAVSPDGTTVYVTDTNADTVAVISAATDRVTRSVKVGEMPWQLAVSASGKTVYVADPDSDAVSVISAATDKVSHTVTVTGDPDTLALTPDGSQLWVGDNSSAAVSVIDTATDTVSSAINLGGSGPQSGDGYEPTGIVLSTTPTAGS